MSTRENIVTTDRLGLKESTFLYGKTNKCQRQQQKDNFTF